MKAPNPFIINPAKATLELMCPGCKRDLGELENWSLCAHDCNPKYAGHEDAAV